jgi:hypothetical protein
MAGAFTPIYWGEESLPIRENCASYCLQELQSLGPSTIPFCSLLLRDSSPVAL